MEQRKSYLLKTDLLLAALEHSILAPWQSWQGTDSISIEEDVVGMCRTGKFASGNVDL